MKATEKILQAAVMYWAMNRKQHRLVVPNSNTLFPWEADLVSVARSGLMHEYEMKCNRADFNRDAAKTFKHDRVSAGWGPAYFWYVTAGFAIEPPEHAGWIVVRHDEASGEWVVDVKKDAPRLPADKLTESQERTISRMLSWRLTNLYVRFFHPGAGWQESDLRHRVVQLETQTREMVAAALGMREAEISKLKARIQELEGQVAARRDTCCMDVELVWPEPPRGEPVTIILGEPANRPVFSIQPDEHEE